ncbi:hypothetical protein GG344DRAFT_66876 [Lentinula edodes]|nr:hypothetical protein GG344DRAFT_66876 [Lentinula edodes]
MIECKPTKSKISELPPASTAESSFNIRRNQVVYTVQILTNGRRRSTIPTRLYTIHSMMLTLQDPEDIREDRRHCDPASEQILNFAEFVYRLASESADPLSFFEGQTEHVFESAKGNEKVALLPASSSRSTCNTLWNLSSSSLRLQIWILLKASLKCRCVRGDGGDSTYCKRCLQDNKECIVSESRRINRPRGPKSGAKGKSRSTQFDQDRNMSASDFEGGITGSLRSPEPIESSSYSIMPEQSPDLVPHLISNAINDHAHYAMAYNVAPVSYHSPWYNYETQTYDHYGESVEAGNSSGTDSWRMEGHSGNNQFSSQESYTAYNTWDGSVFFTEPQSYIADDDFQKRWNYSYSRNL